MRNSSISFDRVVSFEDGTNATMGALGQLAGPEAESVTITGGAQVCPATRSEHAVSDHL